MSGTYTGSCRLEAVCLLGVIVINTQCSAWRNSDRRQHEGENRSYRIRAKVTLTTSSDFYLLAFNPARMSKQRLLLSSQRPDGAPLAAFGVCWLVDGRRGLKR